MNRREAEATQALLEWLTEATHITHPDRDDAADTRAVAAAAYLARQAAPHTPGGLCEEDAHHRVWTLVAAKAGPITRTQAAATLGQLAGWHTPPDVADPFVVDVAYRAAAARTLTPHERALLESAWSIYTERGDAVAEAAQC